jgi:hypothetical protein
LIVEAEDSTRTVRFNLVSLQQLPLAAFTKQPKNTIPTTKEALEKKLDQIAADPSAYFKSLLPPSRTYTEGTATITVTHHVPTLPPRVRLKPNNPLERTP